MVARVLFVTTCLSGGGAEGMLYRMLSRLHGRDIDGMVVSLLGPGKVSPLIEQLGVPVNHLNLEHPLRIPLAAARLARATKHFSPDVIQGWMYHGNVAARFAHLALPDRPSLALGIRQSLYDISLEKPLTRIMIRLGVGISRRADLVVYNSRTSRLQHERFGYSPAGACVIDNGFDTDLFSPDPDAALSVKDELGVPRESLLVGSIARSHPMKGHGVLLEAARNLAERIGKVHFLLAGRGVVAEAREFKDLRGMPELRGRVHLLGERSDIPRLMAALDAACSSSLWGEAFPNATAEAMCCAVPCVVTDIGDSSRVVGDTGAVVPAGDGQALAEALADILALPPEERRQLGDAARRRIEEHFSLEGTARQYAALYAEAAGRGAAGVLRP